MKPFFFLGSVVTLASLVSLAACSSSNDGTNNTTDASTSDTGAAETGAHDSGGNVPSDGSTNDVTAPLDGSDGDGGAIDSGTSDAGQGNSDGATAACTSPSDCVLYSSACDTCACIPLGKSEPKPTCTGTIVTCFIDPCEGKTATCDNGHCGGN